MGPMENTIRTASRKETNDNRQLCEDLCWYIAARSKFCILLCRLQIMSVLPRKILIDEDWMKDYGTMLDARVIMHHYRIYLIWKGDTR